MISPAWVRSSSPTITRHGRRPASFDDPGTTTLLARARAANVDTISIYADSGIVARLARGSLHAQKHHSDR